MSFGEIAHLYDAFNDLASYEDWLEFTLNSLDFQPRKVLDVACGTGWFTQLLSPYCDEIVAFDIDERMLDVARHDVNETNVTWLQADMRDLSALDTDFDLATCYADSFCFLESLEDVEQAFSQISQRLAVGGTLLFDVWTPYKILVDFDHYHYCDVTENAALTWRSQSESDNLKVTHELTVFTQQESGDYQRIDTTLYERTYALQDYLTALKKAGFSKVEVSVNYGEWEYQASRHQEEERWFFRCVKG